LFTGLWLVLSGCSVSRLKKAIRKEQPKLPPLFAVETSTAAAVLSVSTAPVASQSEKVGPAVYYVDYEGLIGQYLQALVKDKELAEAYGKFYSKQNKPLNRVWSNFKSTVDRLGRLVALYPGAAIGMGAYQTVISKEASIKRKISNEEKVAASVQQDIHLSIRQVVRRSNIQVVYDSSAFSMLYLAPEWDLTPRALKTLIAAKKAQLKAARAAKEAQLKAAQAAKEAQLKAAQAAKEAKGAGPAK